MESTTEWLRRLVENKPEQPPQLAGTGLGGVKPVPQSTNGLGRMYRDFAGGANNSLASTLGAPVDLVNRYTFNQPNALLGSDWIRNKMNALGIGTQGQGIAGIGGGLLGSMAIPGSGLLNAIDTSAQIAQAQTPGQMLLAAGGGLLGEGINALSKPKVMQEMTAYHGSPHNFDEFKLDKIGTGEGAQAYGHGLYFAENPNVAAEYRGALTRRDPNRLTLNGENVSPDTMLGRALEKMALFDKKSAINDLQDNIRFNEKYAPDIAELQRSTLKQIETIDPSQVGLKRGSLYHVDIPDSAINNMLDWDKPLSEQTEAVKAAAKKIGIGKAIGPTKAKLQAFLNGTENPERGIVARGEDLYRAVSDYGGGSVEGSKFLHSMGIPGIRYLDGGSRGSGTGTRNFVVFDDKLVKILKKE